MVQIRACRILIVEDDPAVQRFMLIHFRNSGYRVEYALSAEDVSLDEQYDVVLADVHLPGESGVDMLRRIRARMPHQPVVCMTGDADSEVERHALQNGADGFVMKPVDLRELDAVVRGAMRGREPMALA
jgi:two-component system, OmpR family, response regulator